MFWLVIGVLVSDWSLTFCQAHRITPGRSLFETGSRSNIVLHASLTGGKSAEFRISSFPIHSTSFPSSPPIEGDV